MQHSVNDLQNDINKTISALEAKGGVARLSFLEISKLDYMISGAVLEAQNEKRNTLNVLDEIAALAEKHTHSASTGFLTDALMSYMCSSYTLDLSGYTSLDYEGMDIFSRLLQYRHSKGWTNTKQDDAMNKLRLIYPGRWD